MKATKKIVGAACALVAAVALSAGSTFAWFASNETVSATGINVGATTSNMFLLIGKGTESVSDIQGAPSDHITVEFGTGDDDTAKLADNGIDGVSNTADITASCYGTTDSLTPDTATKTTLATVGNWYTATGVSASDGTMDASGKTELTTFNGFVNRYKINFVMAANSAASGNLTVTDIAITPTNSATDITSPVSVYIVTDSYVVSKIKGTMSTNTTLADSVTSTTAVEAMVYVYYDGTDANVTSDNFAAQKLKDATISLSFDAAEATA